MIKAINVEQIILHPPKSGEKKKLKKSLIRETPNLANDADSGTDTFIFCCRPFRV